MKRSRLKILAPFLLAALAGETFASNYLYMQRIKGIVPVEWTEAAPYFSDWHNIGGVYGCTNWSPDPMTITIGRSFTQAADDCKQDQQRTGQNRELEIHSGDLRYIGDPFTENQTIPASASRAAIGALESWAAIDPAYTEWVNTGAIYGCTNWSPSPETVTVGQAFTQTGDCKQDQTRSRQDREREATTGEVRSVGAATSESRTTPADSTRQAVGTKETWAATTPTYTSWVDSGSVTGCTNWSPATSTVTAGQAFTQTASDCDQAQVRTRQERQVETTTGAIRNLGAPVTESRTVTASSTRQAVGTKQSWVAIAPTYSAWANSGDVHSCTSWTPSTATVMRGMEFIQRRTCYQTQVRTIQNREQEQTTGAIRNTTSSQESRSISVDESRKNYGTKSGGPR